jgi:hypothetical protein
MAVCEELERVGLLEVFGLYGMWLDCEQGEMAGL